MPESVNYQQPEYVEKRLRYFDGQYLKVQDFVEEQQYHIDRLRRHNRFLHVSGIVDGLNVKANSLVVTISPGTAIDKDGRQILLNNSYWFNNDEFPKSGATLPRDGLVELDLSSYRGQGKFDLFIIYDERETDQQVLVGSQNSTRFHERPKLEFKESSTPQSDYKGIKLARLTIDNTINTITIDETVREYSGLRLPGAENSQVTLRYVGDKNSRLARLDGSLSVTGNFSVTGSINFAESNRQMLNLWRQAHGIGVQNSTTYFRSSQNFAWYTGGSHNDNALNAGGGTVQMVISNEGLTVNGTGTSSFAGSLSVTGSVTAASLSVDSGAITAGSGTFTNNLSVSGKITPSAGNGDNNGIRFPENPGGGGDAAWIKYYARTTVGDACTLEIGTSNDVGDHIALMPSGNVGIGTTTPTEKLTVNGNISASNISLSGKISGEGTTPVGSVIAYAGSTAPNGWLLCDGAAVKRDTYTDLFTVIGITYGNGDNQNTFNLPDLRGRTIVASGQGANLSNRVLNQKIGAENHQLTSEQMPLHTHIASIGNSGDHTHNGTTDRANPKYYRTVLDNQGRAELTEANHQRGYASGNYKPESEDFKRLGDGNFSNADHTHKFTTLSSGSHIHNVSISSTGGGIAHNNMQPSLVLNYIIKY